MKLTKLCKPLRRYDYKIISMHENDMYLKDLKNQI